MAVGQRHHLLRCSSVRAVDRGRGTKALGDAEAVVVDIDHDDFGWYKELRGEQGCKPDRSGVNDGDTAPGLDFPVELPALEAGGQNVAEHHQRLFVRANRNRVQARIGIRNAHELGLRAIDAVAEDPSAGSAVRIHALAISTRSPTLKLVTPAPTASITPTPSWPRMVPSLQVATSPLRMCRSVPQIVVLMIFTSASVGAWSAGLARSSRRFWSARYRRGLS